MSDTNELGRPDVAENSEHVGYMLIETAHCNFTMHQNLNATLFTAHVVLLDDRIPLLPLLL